jgi:hypothetical protein
MDMDGLVIDRELALRFKALAEGGSDGEIRQELRRLAAEFAGLIIAAEVQHMIVEQYTPPAGGGSLVRLWRWVAWAWLWRPPSYAAGA